MRRNVNYQPPFVYFGGKSAVAEVVWNALGEDVLNYVEPFAGSAAVLFLRDEPGHIETINDADGFVVNAWRSIKHDADAVAYYADDIVSEPDLHARHLWLVGQRESLTDRLCGDLDFYDPKVAGFWLWGINAWIGSGWCSGRGPWISVDGVMTLRNTGQGVNRKLPHLSGNGSPGQGILRRDTGGQARSAWLRDYLAEFAARLRNVRVCCGDWSRVCGPSVTFRHGLTGVFLDPPYADSAARTSDLYAVDCEQVAHDVRRWAIEQGENPLMRIVLAGYDGEHEMPDSWHVHEWQTSGGYALQGEDGSDGRENRKRERLWFSPHCNHPNAAKQQDLFA